MRYKNKIILILISTLLVSAFLGGCKKEEDKEPLSKTEFMMDTVMTIKLYDKKDEVILDKSFDRIREIEDKMSITIEDSDVSKINKNAGKNPVKVDDEVYEILTRAKYFAELTDGAYEPTIGPLVDLWNIRNEGKNNKHDIPSKEDIEKALNKVDYKKLELLEDNKVFLKEEGMKLDLGGIAKGYAADEIKKILKENGVNSAIVDLGGNIYAVGSKGQDEYWKIGIQNPQEQRGSYVGIIEVKDSSVVTSGDYERYFEVNGKRYHHIIDSKTGYPSDNELSAISIIAKSSTDSDALSTALFVLGREKSKEVLKELEDIEVLYVTKSDNIYISPGIKDRFDLNNNNFDLKINEY
ncbi:FAD:protein FMN transferase [Anaerosalibacter bizertensis]|uniref:FAD:protein FMN transferase n=1 Tax=Anaerosalibacter bizertensis TaxID=932217 RepID=A0A844FHN8_9FIRM|nr:FAD:protein FMN transferase [Anaerosalibacter bizertensis]MBV1817686.1 FAD:protein FMN transferase [Bacteroidales bacterium MSK.15.36]HHV27495.1 FAD:protein FMN transferase [Tissierellia bacterium]MCB5559978.1 FAD:protein FMN transferase [Anaerosalibacter bizertensis]MCG4565148.1 FAD:protein FMN transferase [Anaerosalibacter bizertensis]MCG4582071.1 FAD:protein FMN transferase [Anaerosalibacter bizertensis]